MIFQRISDAVRRMLLEQGIRTWNYIDDTFAAFERPDADMKFNTMCNLMQELGLPLNPDKVNWPAEALDIMGITVNVRDRSLAIPHQKMTDIVTSVTSFMKKAQ